MRGNRYGNPEKGQIEDHRNRIPEKKGSCSTRRIAADKKQSYKVTAGKASLAEDAGTRNAEASKFDRTTSHSDR